MKYKKGDKVRFLNAVGEGVVTKTTTDGTVFVLDETGFEVPSTPEELIMIKEESDTETSPDYDNEPSGNDSTPEFYPEYTPIEGNDEPKSFFALVPQQDKEASDADLEAYLINDSNFIIFYNIIEQTQQTNKGIEAGIIEPNTKLSLFTLMRQQIGQSGDYLFQLIFYREGSYTPVPPVEQKIVISPVKLYKENTFKANNFFHERALIFNLTKKEEPTETPLTSEAKNEKKKLKELEKMLQSKTIADIQPKPKPTKPQKEEKREIDLHINTLVDNTKGLENGDILEIQMNRFREEMQKAIKDNLKKIIFIHGIGNGTLKNALRKELSQQYKKYPYHDASFKEYGFGATLVIIRN